MMAGTPSKETASWMACKQKGTSISSCSRSFCPCARKLRLVNCAQGVSRSASVVIARGDPEKAELPKPGWGL